MSKRTRSPDQSEGRDCSTLLIIHFCADLINPPLELKEGTWEDGCSRALDHRTPPSRSLPVVVEADSQRHRDDARRCSDAWRGRRK